LNTPLHIASEGGYIDIIKLLLQNHADINAQTINICFGFSMPLLFFGHAQMAILKL